MWEKACVRAWFIYTDPLTVIFNDVPIDRSRTNKKYMKTYLRRHVRGADAEVDQAERTYTHTQITSYICIKQI